jgi:beta-phosphoglucomutase-like phosphatase (HAD superfamily)
VFEDSKNGIEAAKKAGAHFNTSNQLVGISTPFIF